MRHLQRDLREYFSTRAEQAQRTTAEAVHAATAATKAGQEDHERRLADLDAELGRLAKVRETAETLALLASGTPAGAAA